MVSFDPRGTKDGNLWARLFGFVRSVWAQRLGLDASAIDFLKGLPMEAQQTVMMKFDPGRTKDGNILARLEAFAWSITGGQMHSSGGSHSSKAADGGGSWGSTNGRPQQAALQEVPEARQPIVSLALQEFTEHWKLNQDAVCFLADLSENVQQAVISSFQASGTKDGNVWGRLFGFVRSVWAQRISLDKEAFGILRGLAEEVQMTVMTQYSGEAESAEEVAAHLHDIQAGGSPQRGAAAAHAPGAGYPRQQKQRRSQPWQDSGNGGGGSGGLTSYAEQRAINDFLERCNLTACRQEAEELLFGLEAESRSAVLSDFDPGGTKDGNVLGRLRGFASAVENRRKRARTGNWGW